MRANMTWARQLIRSSSTYSVLGRRVEALRRRRRPATGGADERAAGSDDQPCPTARGQHASARTRWRRRRHARRTGREDRHERGRQAGARPRTSRAISGIRNGGVVGVEPRRRRRTCWRRPGSGRCRSRSSRGPGPTGRIAPLGTNRSNDRRAQRDGSRSRSIRWRSSADDDGLSQCRRDATGWVCANRRRTVRTTRTFLIAGRPGGRRRRDPARCPVPVGPPSGSPRPGPGPRCPPDDRGARRRPDRGACRARAGCASPRRAAGRDRGPVHREWWSPPVAESRRPAR